MAEELILVVEDNDLLREGLQETLTMAGFEVIAARNGDEALQAMHTISPTLIVSDIAMPIMDGFEFFTQVRANRQWVTIPFIFLTARIDPRDVQRGRNLGVDDYLTKPVTPSELVTAVRSRLNRMRQLQMAQIKQAYISTLSALANAIEVRSFASEPGHVDRMMILSVTLAETMGWSQPRIENLRYAAILHDIGKIHISKEILDKPGPLNADEWALVRLHPQIGADMVRDVPLLNGIIPIIRGHHERWDGSGYPDGLSGRDIPAGARILAVADALDAMTRTRPFQEARPLRAALDEIIRLSGVYYDPAVVQALKKAHLAGRLAAIA